MPVVDFPGTAVAPNLTPDAETGAANFTDEQIARAIREGIKHNGTTLFPMMPYSEYRELADEDVASVVVFLRSLPPVRNPLPASKINFPVNYLVRSAPQPVNAPVAGPGADQLARGKYMVSLGSAATTLSKNCRMRAAIRWSGRGGRWSARTSRPMLRESATTRKRRSSRRYARAM